MKVSFFRPSLLFRKKTLQFHSDPAFMTEVLRSKVTPFRLIKYGFPPLRTYDCHLTGLIEDDRLHLTTRNRFTGHCIFLHGQIEMSAYPDEPHQIVYRLVPPAYSVLMYILFYLLLFFGPTLFHYSLPKPFVWAVAIFPLIGILFALASAGEVEDLLKQAVAAADERYRETSEHANPPQ